MAVSAAALSITMLSMTNSFCVLSIISLNSCFCASETHGNVFLAALTVLLVLGAVRTLCFLCAEAVSVQQSKMAVINEYLVISF